MQKALHISIILVIIVAIVFTALMLVLKYDEKGETNMAFTISKISIISTVDAIQNEDNENLWNKTVQLNNDIYIYVEKNSEYKKTEAIKSIEIDNIKGIQSPQIGKLDIYKPITDEKKMFNNTDENKSEKFIYTGTQKTQIQEMKISNQGGIIAFRIANNEVGNYVSNEGTELNYNEILKKMGITYEQINSKISFDVNIILQDDKQFKTTVDLDIPIEEVIENGRGSKEIKDLNLIFKRIET